MHAPAARMPFKIHDENAYTTVKRTGKVMNGKLSSSFASNNQIQLPLSDVPLTKQKSIIDNSNARQSNRKALSNLSTSQVNSRLTNSVPAETSKLSKAYSGVITQNNVGKLGTGPTHVLFPPSSLISHVCKATTNESSTLPVINQAVSNNLSEGMKMTGEEAGKMYDFTEVIAANHIISWFHRVRMIRII